MAAKDDVTDQLLEGELGDWEVQWSPDNSIIHG